MNKLVWIGIVIIAVGSQGALCDSADEFNRIVDFSITLKALGETLDSSRVSSVDREKLVILHGTVSSIAFLDTKKASYTVQLELVYGEWLGLEEVRSYRGRVTFRGPQYVNRIPRRVPADAGLDVIQGNSRVIVIARVVEPVVTALGERMWQLDGIEIRRTE